MRDAGSWQLVRERCTRLRDRAWRLSLDGSRRLRYGTRRLRDEAYRRWRAATPERRQTWRVVALSTAAGLVLSAVAVGAAGPWDAGQRTAERARAAGAAPGGPGDGAEPAPSAAPVLPALGVPDGTAGSDSGEDEVPAPTGHGLANSLRPLLDDPALGPVRSASIVDVSEGRQLFGSDQDAPVVPASTIKLATGAAVLSALGPGHRIATRVVAGGSGHAAAGARVHDIVLVGGGDPTLTARRVSGSNHPASLRDLAADTARALKRHHAHTVRLGYDTSLYSGPRLHPIGPNENIAPVTPLMADEGRLDDSDSGPAPRSADPAADAAHTFASLLHDHGIDVTGKIKDTRAAKKADALATVRSQPLSAIIERMLTNSDNDIAENMARQTALASGQPASFAGAAKAVVARLERLRLPLDRVHVTDGSGLNRADHVTSLLLAEVLVRAASPQHPELRPLITGLPVAGFTGTLRSRYAKDAVGRGVVRAKTGTLTGVNTLAGTVVDADGRLLVFAFMTNGTTDPDAAQHALDRLASALANCGCR